MTQNFQYPTEYFLQEGKENLSRCLDATFAAADAHNIKKIVIFTAAGTGVTMAIDNYLSQPQYSTIELIAVTFPSQAHFTAESPSDQSISPELAHEFARLRIPIVRSHLPFDPIRTHYEGRGILGQDFGLIDNALRIFSGGMSLCVQSVLMASDAGYLSLGEHTIAMTADTSILVRAAATSRFLTDLIVREIICKPVLLTIGKTEERSNPLSAPTSKQPLELKPPNES
jgi:uncharacterized protein